MNMQENYKIVESFLKERNIEYYINQAFSNFSSFNVGGNIDLYIVVKKISDFLELADFLCKNVIDYFVMGDTSKVIVSDNGYNGIVVSLEGEFESFEFLEDGVLKSNSSAILERLSHESRIRNLSGLEFVALVNTRIGAAIYDKLESFGISLLNFVKSITLFNKQSCTVTELTKDEYLALTEKERRFIIILSVVLVLEKDSPESIDNRIDWFRYIRGAVAPTEASIGPVFEDFYDVKAYEMVERVGGLDMKFGAMKWHARFPNYIINESLYDSECDCKAEDVINLIEDTRKKIEQHYAFNPKINIVLLS
ncbi:UDP-N-acetylmuramate dehydrogenase [Brachyspira hyodysenteriae]|uniref:UDP-N-acetylmuramate dehydrogenase n=1 Tax=Brachyspira hyodysenteriae TaxID=159 RepID=UPI002B25CCB5|nr:UDP-N-acetylmuramate dehydrogenase [Brachyspira hyodysenteriae]WPC37959.1 UDP-N-acetylmuramate dehydrogenase [Brachyspira hyodysenteriae]